jgi:hypothetical membrane protein
MITIPLILVAVSYSPWFSWTDNALSDLGVQEAAGIFNSALVTGGVLTLMFAAGLTRSLRKNGMTFVGTFVLVLAAVSLLLIGVFPESSGRIHFYVSVSFFTLAILAMLLIGVGLVSESSGRRVGAFSIIAGVFSVVVWAVFWNLPYKGVAIPEMLASLSTSAWSLVMGIRLYKQASKP